ncbi:Sas10 C-terminal domain-containing protein [Xylaria bambusicola]|uniref:Sas10 C-terminal domain-containing protein n=1 Tax=Xylaria bambusicola TaxID=326684 RepID=UPI0020080E27|nr:Sas10 C-terminal domain-containing protein [Xylaria bambusicola]KAI0526623.1 Sas10 C-terminal domain-containing protein [Xylaria bambusicola]
MGKKRKASSTGRSSGPREYDPKDGKLGPVSSYRDIMDDQERFEEDDDEIMFDEGPKTKRQKAEELLEDDDEEILAYSEDSDSDEDDDDDDDDDEPRRKQSRKPGKSGQGQNDDDSDDEEKKGEEEHDDGYWGSSRKDYYDADQIETTVDAEEEEKEALRLQKKKLAKMSEADFFNEDEWLAGEAEDADQDEVVTEVLKEVEIPPDMSPEERNRLLQARYPELPFLADELLQLQPRLVEFQKEAEGQEPGSLAVVQYRVLGSLIATLAMYFGILTSPARDGDGVAKTLDPSELREHEVMSTLLECRDAWKKVESLKASKPAQPAESLPSPPEDEDIDMLDDEMVVPKQARETNKAKRAKAKAERKSKAIEDSLADLDSLLALKKISKKKTALKDTEEDSNSDFGEEEYLDSKMAAEKAARKKSLRFYTSQIAQKSNRRAAGGRDAGGDMDIPYRERLKDRRARLNAEAEKRGKKGSNIGADLGEGSDDEDHETARAIRDEANEEYYDMIAAASNKRKNVKAAKAEAVAAAGSADRVVEVEKVGPDGRREITYAIKANKGLAPKRKKEVRNPRGMCHRINPPPPPAQISGSVQIAHDH